MKIIREQGAEALSARTLSKALDCSISPIFTIFKNMDEVLENTRSTAVKLFDDYVADVTDYEPAFKEFGLRLIRFAREEKNLFQYLFLQKDPPISGIHPKAAECLGIINAQNGIDAHQTDLLFHQMWTFACGLALLSSQEPDKYPEETVSQMLSFQFSSTLGMLKSGKALVSPTPRHITE